jgi:CRISPR-associated RAMP protein (TIGR02581 family)
MQGGNNLGLWEEFKNRVIVEAELVCRSGLRVGCGSDPAQPTASDLPVMVDRTGQPFLPGSSIRGVFRSHLERFVRAVENPQNGSFDGRGACNPVVEKEWCVTKSKIDDLRAGARGVEGEYDDNHFARAVWQATCRICRVFGSPWLASRVRFADLTVCNDTRIETRDGVAIDREKETVENKYDFQVVPVGTRFRLWMSLENTTDAERGLIFFGLRELANGTIAVGGFKGRGLGNVCLENMSAKWIDFENASKDDRKAFLVYGQMRDCSSSEITSWIESFWSELEIGPSGVQAG